MSKTIRIRKGFDIKLKGAADKREGGLVEVSRYAIKPADFPGLTPKLSVKADDIVKAGTPLFHAKSNPEVLFTSPVSGKVVAINRGERRRILEVEIESDGKFESEDFSTGEIRSFDRETVKQNLLKSGLWPYITQRPFGVIAKPADVPRDIFVSGFDSAPMAPDYEFTLAGEMEALQAGFDVLSKLTDGKVYLGLRSGSKFASLKGVEVNYFEGPHPAGNVGIQIHHIAPINKGDLVWTVDMQAVVFMGRLFTSGKLNLERLVAFTGSEVKDPQYYKSVVGASVETLLKDRTLKNQTERIISGNVLTGVQIKEKGYLGMIHHQLSVIPEGNDIEPFGWATPGLDKLSPGKAFISKLFPKKEYVLNANYHGGERAFVMSEQYEKYLPMDILPVFLLKSILVNDIDKMEQLGIYELIEEDMALCEYACTSKIEVQEILRTGLNVMIKELG